MSDEPRSGEGHDADRQGLDGGAYIGNRPELAEDTIPGGVSEDDERVAGYDSRSSGEGKAEQRVQGGEEWPAGHREAANREEG